MKKTLLTVFITLVALTSVFATNQQKIYDVESEVFCDIKNIYIMTGHSLPSTTGPWSSDELSLMISKISRSEVPSALLDDYDFVLETLTQQPEYDFLGIQASFNHEVNLEFYYHNNNNSEFSRTGLDGITETLFQGRQYWPGLEKNSTPTYMLKWETWAADKFYSYLELGLHNTAHCFPELGNTKLSTSLLSFQDMKFNTGGYDSSIPFRALVAFGGKNWSVEFGRDKLSWGAGNSGNLTISNNMPYQNFLKFTTYSAKYKYTFLTSVYPHECNYFSDSNPQGVFKWKTGQDGLDGISMYIGHRIEGRFFQDKLGLAITESIMYGSKTNHIDLATIMPVQIFHNAFTPDTSNSELALEADWTPFNGLNLYGQFLLDDYGIGGETIASPEVKSNPNRFAFLLGATYVTNVENSILSFNAEYAQVDANTYMRGEYSSDYSGFIDFIVDVRQHSGSINGISHDLYYQGYTYGSDCRVLNFNSQFEKENLKISANFLYLCKGTHDLWTKYVHTGGEGKDAWKTKSTSPTTQSEGWNYRWGDTSNRNCTWNTYDLSLYAEYANLVDNLTLKAKVDFIKHTGIFNIQGQNDSDVQVVIGAKYCF